MFTEKANNMSEINYDAVLIWDIIGACNFSCDYCANKNRNVNTKFEIINAEKILNVLDKTNKKFKLSLNGGEPFLLPNIVEFSKLITHKHSLHINTNLSVKNTIINNFAENVPLDKFDLLVSFHQDEIEKRNMLPLFVENLLILKRNNANFKLIMVVKPSKIKDYLYWENFFSILDLTLNPKEFMGVINGISYPQGYTDEEKIALKFSDKNLRRFTTNGMKCIAGYCAAYCSVKNGSNGEISPCPSLSHNKNLNIGNIYEGINFNKQMIKCPLKQCSCPIWSFYSQLQEKSLIESPD